MCRVKGIILVYEDVGQVRRLVFFAKFKYVCLHLGTAAARNVNSHVVVPSPVLYETKL
jgi:hypothetical protein